MKSKKKNTPHRINFSRPELISMSLDKYEKIVDKYIKKKGGIENLSRNENKLISKQKRLIQNRISASISRKRKIEKLNKLEQEKQDLINENKSIKDEIDFVKKKLEDVENINGELIKLITIFDKHYQYYY